MAFFQFAELLKLNLYHDIGGADPPICCGRNCRLPSGRPGGGRGSGEPPHLVNSRFSIMVIVAFVIYNDISKPAG